MIRPRGIYDVRPSSHSSMYQKYEYMDIQAYLMPLQKVESVIRGRGRENKKQQKQNKLIYGDHSCVPPFLCQKRRNPGYPLMIPKRGREKSKTRPKNVKKAGCQNGREAKMSWYDDNNVRLHRCRFGCLRRKSRELGGSCREYNVDIQTFPARQELEKLEKGTKRTEQALASLRSDQRPNGDKDMAHMRCVRCCAVVVVGIEPRKDNHIHVIFFFS